MKTLATRALATLLAVTITASAAPTARAAVPTAPPDASPLGLIPPRLSYLDGAVSLWRPGAQDWSPAAANLPLAAGDELYTAHQRDLELHNGTRALVLPWAGRHVW